MLLQQLAGRFVFYHRHVRRWAISNKSDRKKQEELARQQAEDRARQQALITQAAQPKPVESAVESQQLGWLNATSGKDGPIDITKLPGMGPSYGLYDSAINRQQGERMGIGALRLGAQGANGNLSRLLQEQSLNERQQQAAGQFENAYRFKDAEMRGSVLPLLGLQQSRSMGLASLASGNAANSTNAWSNFRPAPSFWQQLLLTGVGAAGNAVQYRV